MKNLFKFIAYFISGFILTSCGFLEDNFGKPGIEQIIFHLNFANAGTADKTIIWSGIKECIIFPAFIAALLTWLEYYFKRNYKFHLIFLLYSLVYIVWDLSLLTFVSNRLSGADKEYIAKNYVDPRNVKIVKKSDLKNLILIYIESMEDSYRNEQLFEKNLIKELDTLNNTSFSKYHQVPGTDWTTAAIVATQCAMPMKVIALFSDQDNLKEGYYPELECLGNVLKNNGYKNIFMGGASLNFGRKGKFLSSHGYGEVYGRDEWVAMGASKKMMNEWGIYDDLLFEHAKKRLLELHSSKELFNLTLLTVEMHYPKGYFSPTCIKRGAKTYEDIVECASYQVKDFVDYAEKIGILENTNIVILGDHLAPISMTKNKLSKKESRTIFNSFISKDKFITNRKEINHFDIFPTVIEFLGLEIRGGKLGLGYSGFSRSVDISKIDAPEAIREKLLPKNDRYNQFLKTVVPGHEELDDNF